MRATGIAFPRRKARYARRIRCTRAIIDLEFRTRPDHPPTAPIFNGDRISARWRLGDVKLPGKIPTSRQLMRAPNRVAIVGSSHRFRKVGAIRALGHPFKVTKYLVWTEIYILV